LHTAVCIPCGTATYYRIAVDATGEKVFNRLVAPGAQTNRLEIEIKPAASGTADIYMKLNGQVSFVAYKVSVEPSEVGLYIDWHSVGAIFDNFEFEKIEP
jgi:hypothetical protein